MYATTLEITNFKCFGKAHLALQYPGRRSRGASELANVNVILGDNGGGKSSVLRALAIAALAPILLGSGFVPYRLVRRARLGQAPVQQCQIKLKAALSKLDRAQAPELPKGTLDLLAQLVARKAGADRLEVESAHPTLTQVLEDDNSPAVLVVGYGATRRVETSDYSESSARRSRGQRYGRVAGLFEDHVTMRPMQLWLPRVLSRNPARQAEIAQLLEAVLPEGVRFTWQIDEANGQYLFDFEGQETPMSALSDGYKAFVGWVTDLVGHLADVAPDTQRLSEIPGLVLVDEIDLHLHPQWQLTVVPTLAQAFPKLQFVFTSHSPLVANTVRKENVFVTASAADGTATIAQLQEHVYARGIDQLLRSSYFGLTTTKPASFQAESQLLFDRAAQGDAAAALTFVERLSGTSPSPAAPLEGSGP